MLQAGDFMKVGNLLKGTGSSVPKLFRFMQDLGYVESKRDFLRTVTPALLTDGLRIEGGI